MNEILPRQCPDMSQVTKTAILTQGASTAEYGRIIIFKKDGTEAATFGLTGDIRIGRDRNSDIRLKIPSVSRNHARVYQDENGNCNIENLSSGNVTTVNGELVQSSIILKDGDVFCVGLREFVYQNSDKMTSTDSNANLIVRHVPILETIDESLTLDFAKHLPQKARGKPLTPIRENINEATSPMKPSTVFEIVLDKPVACENKPSTPNSKKKPSTPKQVKSPGDSLKKMNAATVKQVNENIKDAINERRKSFGASITSKSPKAPIKSPKGLKSHTPIKKLEDTLVGQALTSSQNETLLQAVNARRKSMTSVSIVQTVDPINIMKNEVNLMEAPKSVSATPLSPIREAINARRRISLTLDDIKAYNEPPATGIFEGVTIVVSHEPKRNHSEQFTTSSISRRMSVGGSNTTVLPVPRQSKRNSIAAPLYRSSRLSLSKKDLEVEVNAKVVAELSIDEDIVLSCDANNRDSILTFPSTSNEIVEGKDLLSCTPIKSVEQRGVVIKQAICVQLAVDAFANELEMQGVPAGRAYATAIDTYLSNPSAFSPKPIRTKSDGPYRRDSLLVSLEAKAHTTGSSLFGANGGDQAELSCDLIAALTESDMDIIDAYALRLEMAGGDAGESYAIALDAFVRGVEHCHLKVKVETAPIVLEDPVPIDILVAVQHVSAVCVVEEMIVCEVSGCDLPPTPTLECSTEDVDPNMGASLRALFELPSDYEGRDAADDDEKLVARYAEDLRDEACIDAAVAYGIALDTFLADPVAFRDQIGGVKARLQEQYQREAFQTPEYEYDFYYEDEAHSLAKSTVKKIELPSNSHIFFSSPTPVTTPCKMASLCENGANEDENEDNSIINSSVKMTSYEVEMIEIEPMECETDQSSMLPDVNMLVSDISDGNALPICPTTPSRACFESAFSVLKSVKKSPFQASASKEEVQTPIKSVKKSPFQAPASKKEVQTPVKSVKKSPFQASASKKEVQTPIKSAKKSPFQAPASKKEVETPIKSVKKSPFQASGSKKEVQTPPVELISSIFTFDVESDDRMNSISTDIIEIVETFTVTNTVNLEADIIDNVGTFFDIPTEELIVLDKEIVPIIFSPVPEAIMTMSATTPVKVESWLASAAASLKKSLPPQSEKRTASNSARKIKIPTPRQSRLGSGTPSKSPASYVNLFQESSIVEIAVQAVIDSVVSIAEESNELIAEVVAVESGEVQEEMVKVVIVAVTTALDKEVVDIEIEKSIDVPDEVIATSVVENLVEVKTDIIVSDIETPLGMIISTTLDTANTPTKEVSVQEIKVATPARSTRSRVATALSAVKSLTPARVTRSKIPTPAPKVLEPAESVVRSTRSRSTPSKKVIDIPVEIDEITTVKDSSAVTDVPVVRNEVNVCIPTPVRRNTSKRSNSILATLSADAMIAKRSRKEEMTEDKFQVDVIVPDMIVFPSEEVPDMIVFHDIVANDIVVSVPPVEEVKKRGRPSRLVKAVEVKEEEEEVALALLCDGCDSEHFLEDLGLKNIPEGDWFCNSCVTKKSLPVVSSPRKSSRRSVVTSSILKETPSKSIGSVDTVITRKRTIELTDPSPAPDGRRSARLH